MPSPTTETTFDGSIISATITGITAHTWTANAAGLFTTTADLKAEWTADAAILLAGHADTLSPLARLEGNAETILDNTAAARLSASSLAQFRQDLQREFDAIGAAMQIDQSRYGIDPTLAFNTYTYLKLEETLQGNEALRELGYQGHGVNTPSDPRYNGFTVDFQNKVDGKTFYVGGGPGNGELAIANFLDDDVLSHAPFPTVLHNGVLTQLNQNGNLENAVTDSVTAANNAMFDRVLVASDFSTNKAAIGAVVMVPHPPAAPPAPTVPPPPPGAPPAFMQTFDGSVIAAMITTTAHQWAADATGLFLTWADLATEWRANEAVMLAGRADTLTPLQRLEGNAEAVLDNTGARKLTVSAQAALRQDLQREFDAIDAALRIDQATYGIDPNAPFTLYTYEKLQQTIQGDEALKELGYQGHGVNSPPATRYDGFTTDFQNRIDGTTFYVGGGPGNGELAIANFLDDDVLTHAPFPVVMHNGVLTQLNQNGNLENALTDAVLAANNATYWRVLVASDFNTDKTATGAVQLVPQIAAAPDAPSPVAAGVDVTLDPGYFAAHNPTVASAGLDPVSDYHTVGWRLGANPNAWFDTNFYLAQNPDVKAAGIDPLWHFETSGWREGRDPSLVFSDSKYLAANPDVAAAGLDPLQHYEAFGQAEGRLAFLSGPTAPADPLVQAAYYDPQRAATLLPTGTAAEQQAAADYASSGWQIGLNPDAYFSTNYYLSHNADVAAAHLDPLWHFENFGWREGRDPSAEFSTSKYLAAYADVKAAAMDPLVHYLEFGRAEGRLAFGA